ncbi:MAG TPA: glycosyltransferase family 4 protein [Herpetosiphonaceae bacterium]
MRIAHVTATFPPYRGGTGNVCFHNARELARAGHEAHVFTSAIPGAPARETLDGVLVHRLRPLLRVGNAPVLPGLLTALRGFDLIHLHYPFFGGELSALAARLAGAPLVVTYHQDVFLAGALGVAERILRHTVGRLALRSARRVLFTSRDYGEASYARALLRGREDRIGELPNGVDAERFSPGPAAAGLRERLGVPAAAPVALLVAGLDRAHAFKGVDVLLAALARLPDAWAVLVGDGDLRPSYAAQAAALGVAGRVRFAGRVATDELPEFYRLADVGVLPSVTMGEAFGLVLLESMACARPVVASNLPGVRTVVDDGADGLLAPPGDAAALADALGSLLSDPGRRQAMGERGRLKAEQRYSWPRIGERLEAIYREVAAGRRGRAAR